MKRGFTLIEVLVVITIVAILAVLAISSYGVARRKAKLDVVTDSLVTVLRQQQSLAKSGKQGNLMTTSTSDAVIKPTCYGMLFSKTDPYVQILQAPYVTVDESVDVNRSDFCDMRDGFYKAEKYSELEDFQVSVVSAFGTEQEQYAIMFRPPEARVSVGSELGSLSKAVLANDPRVMIQLVSANKSDDSTFVFDVTTGVADRLLPSTQELP